jgi:hypothetical protein
MLLVASAVAILSGIAAAEPAAPLRVTWSAPADCPSEASVRARVDALLHASADAALGAGMAVDARARAVDDGTWLVELDLTSAGARRRRSIPGGRDCKEAAEAAAVVIAIAIDPEAASRVADAPDEVATPDPESTAIPEAPSVPEPDPAPQEAPAEPDPTPRPLLSPRADAAPKLPAASPLRGVLGVFGAVGFGHMPAPAAAIGIEGGIALPRVRVTASGLWWFRHRESFGSAAIDFRQWSTAVRACPVFEVHRYVEILACGGVEIGQTIVRTSGLRGGEEPAPLWLAWLVQPALVIVPRPWLGVRVAPEVFGPFWLTAYDVAPIGEVFRVRPVGIRGVLALEARFP